MVLLADFQLNIMALIGQFQPEQPESVGVSALPESVK
jgi:hypothetical protein